MLCRAVSCFSLLFAASACTATVVALHDESIDMDMDMDVGWCCAAIVRVMSCYFVR